MNRSRRTTHAWLLMVVLCAAAVVACPSTVRGRTVELRGKAWDRAAVIDERVPAAGWAGRRINSAQYAIHHLVDVLPGKALLVRYDLGDIPQTMRVTKAEWIFRVNRHRPSETRMFLWRLLAPWGEGVCHRYRKQAPEPLEWSSPGARGDGVDRAATPSRTIKIKESAEVVVNVTEDVSMWHEGVLPNEGWMLTVPDRHSYVRLLWALVVTRYQPLLRITYEPK